MASWESEVAKSTYDANSVVTNMETNRARDGFSEPSAWDQFTGNADPNGDSFGSVGGEQATGFFGNGPVQGYNIVGINGNEVGNMCAAIEDYVASVQSVLKTAIDTTRAELNTGFRGSQAEASVKAYLEKTREYINNLSSTLNSFQAKLNDVGNAWVSAQANIAASVSASSGAFDAGKQYTVDVQYNGPSGSSSPAA